MKKIFLAAAACLVLFGCNNKPQMEAPRPDVIEVTPGSATFGTDGGSADVIVTSNADWTLTADAQYSWVTTSKSEGKDGDIVTFTVEANVEADRTADFTFKSGEATASFKLFSYAGEAPALELDSESELSLGFEAEQIAIKLSSNKNHYRDVEYALSEGAAAWLTYRATLPGDTEAEAIVYFDVAELEGLEDREATITLSVPGLTPVTVELTQFAKHVLSTEKDRYTVAVEGETINIPLSANVEYEVEIAFEDGAGEWLSYGKETEEGLPFTAAALESGKRAATVTFTQTDAEEGEEPLSCEVTITQVNAIISWAAEMTGNRLFPKWEGGGPGSISTYTLETLVKFDDFDKPSGGIMTIMGIEGQFLLRTGDGSNPLNRLQLATCCGNADAMFHFEANTWYHLALVWENRIAKLYVDGKLEFTSTQFPESSRQTWWPYTTFYLDPMNLSPTWSYEADGTRVFWMGYSYDANRDLHGQMTEIRIWTKALTAEEITAPNHFYEVDPESEGLYSYWKFTEGEGSTIADATGKGNPLHGETDITKQENGDNSGPVGIEWVSVALPDR